MTFPTVGIIASHQVRGIYEFEALKLGIKFNFISEKCSVEELIEFSQGCDLVCVDPKIISPASIKTVEKAGIKIYPSTNTLEQFQKISTSKNNGELLSILVARSAHLQVSTWSITLITDNLTITPAPSMNFEQSQEIQLSALKLADEIGLIGAVELLVDANDYKKLLDVNWLAPNSGYWSQIGSKTNFYEQNLRAVLDLPLGSTDINSQFILTGKLSTDSTSDDYRPYLHLMARNPELKFNQVSKEVGITGDNLEDLLTEVIHTQQYYSGEINE
jgi:phosphoribosylaminoimidazole carboxylase (NCAIR synthetase)